MAGRITGKNGELWLPMGDGISYDNQALALTASKVIQGTTYTDRFLGTSSRTAWNRGKTCSVRLQGIVGEATIVPHADKDKVTVSAFKFYKDNGTIVSCAGGAVSITRDAAKAQWNMIAVDTSGALDNTAGTVSSDTSFNDTFDSAGGPAYVAVTKWIVGAVKATPGAAAVVTAAEIVYANSSGTLLQERSDVPGFTILPMEGGILLNEATLKCHTGGLGRVAYADFYDQYPLITKVGDLESISISGSSDTIVMEAIGDYAPQSDLSGPPKSSGTASRFYVDDDTLWKLAMQRRAGIIRVYPDKVAASTKYWEMAVWIKSYGVNVGVGQAVKENFAFDVDGNIELRGY